MSHPKFVENFGNVPVPELSISTRIFTRRSNRTDPACSLRICKTIITRPLLFAKSLMLSGRSGLMWKLAKEIQKNMYPSIKLLNTNIDAQMMWLTKNPEDYGVIVAGNIR